MLIKSTLFMNSVVSYVVAAVAVLLVPFNTFAVGLIDETPVAGGNNEFANFIANTLSFINDYLVPFVLALAFLAFIWGVFKFFVLGGSDEEKQKEGKSLIIYSLVGFIVILSLYGIISLLVDGLGTGGGTITVPTVPDTI